MVLQAGRPIGRGTSPGRIGELISAHDSHPHAVCTAAKCGMQKLPEDPRTMTHDTPRHSHVMSESLPGGSASYGPNSKL